MNSPASIFGHTFIILKKNEKIQLDDIVIEFIGNMKGISMSPIKSLFSSIPGHYKLKYWYEKRREYDLENRDIWEYELNTTVTDIKRLWSHYRKIKGKTFEYNFFFKNCSYYLLELITNTLNEETDLLKSFPGYTVPIETIKSLKDRNHIKNMVFYRSSFSKLLLSYKNLQQKDKEKVKSFLKKLIIPKTSSKSFNNIMSPILNYKILREQNKYKRDKMIGMKKNYHGRIVNHSSKNTENPINIHDPQKVSLSHYRQENKNHGLELSFTPSLHSYEDFGIGDIKGINIEFLKVTADYNFNNKTLIINEFTPIKIQGLSPVNFIENTFSRLFEISFNRNKIHHENNEYNIYSKFGLGVASKTERGFFCGVTPLVGIKYTGFLDERMNESFQALIGSRINLLYSFEDRLLINISGDLEWNFNNVLWYSKILSSIKITRDLSIFIGDDIAKSKSRYHFGINFRF